MFGSGISYLTIDLIGIWKTSDEHDFAEKRDRYLSAENPPDVSYYHQLDYGRMKKIVHFIDRYLDSITPENEMKMEIHHASPMMAIIAALREKYDLHMSVERYVSAETPETENRFIRK